MKLELFQKDETHPFPVAIFKNDKYAPGQPCIQFLWGIGERSTKKSLKEAAAWPPLGALSGTSLAMACDHFQFNIVAVQTSNEYEFGEIPYGYKMASEYLQADPNRIHLLGHSLGFFGVQREVSKNADLVKAYATITSSASGPGTSENTAKNLAASNRPVWIFTSLTDNKDGTTPQVSENLYKAMVDMGYQNVWLTEFKDVTHNAILSTIVAAWANDRGQPGAWSPINTTNATGLNKPAVKSWYEWLFTNALNAPIRSPLDAKAPDPIPIPAPVPETPKKLPRFILYDDNTWAEVTNV